MYNETRRTTALDLAMRWNSMNNIDCPGCLLTLAMQFDEFLRDGKVADIQHVGQPDDDQPDLFDNVVDFDPTKGRPN